MVAGEDEMLRRMDLWWGRSMVLLKCRSVRRKLPGEQWSRRETVEARGTKRNFDVEMYCGISGPPLESRRDEGAATAQATATTAQEPPPQPDSHEPEMRSQGVDAKALRITAFWSEIGSTPECPKCETPSPGKSHTRWILSRRGRE